MMRAPGYAGSVLLRFGCFLRGGLQFLGECGKMSKMQTILADLFSGVASLSPNCAVLLEPFGYVVDVAPDCNLSQRAKSEGVA